MSLMSQLRRCSRPCGPSYLRATAGKWHKSHKQSETVRIQYNFKVLSQTTKSEKKTPEKLVYLRCYV